MDVCEWVERLEIVREVVNERERNAKAKMKEMYDKRRTIVLTKIPRLQNDALDGPYEAIRKFNNANSEIAVPHHRAKTTSTT